MQSLNKIISACKNNDAIAQQYLYDHYKSVLFGIVKRYIKKDDDAEDVFIEGFYKIFSKIDSYQGKGSFEGWMKRIMINEALMHLRKRQNFNLSVESDDIQIKYNQDIEGKLHFDELIEIMNQLPTGYRTVFNMYVIEGFKHREISEQLGISINTSKSQLIAAKQKFQLLIKKKQLRTG